MTLKEHYPKSLIFQNSLTHFQLPKHFKGLSFIWFLYLQSGQFPEEYHCALLVPKLLRFGFEKHRNCILDLTYLYFTSTIHSIFNF